MFIIEKSILKTDRKQLITSSIIKLSLESGESSSFKIMAINDNLITLGTVNGSGDIFLLNTTERTLKNIVTNLTKKVAYVGVINGGVDAEVNISTLSYEVKNRIKKDEELKVNDSFMYNNSIKCVVSYLSEDKSLMVVKYINSGKEIAVEYKDAFWLKNANIKGRV